MDQLNAFVQSLDNLSLVGDRLLYGRVVVDLKGEW